MPFNNLTFNSWQWWLSGGPLSLLAFGFQSNDTRILLAAGASAATISLLAWINAYQRGKAIADTPTSSIAAAAQGYVELQGTASNKPEYYLVGKSGLTCVWFRCISYQKDNDDNWQEFERQVSDSIFEISDASGERCLVDPDHAEIVTTNKRSWYQDSYKYVEEQLIPGQNLYVLGDFSTLSPDSGQADINSEVSQLLKSWKQDHAGMLQHFDTNRDGKIDLQEWEQARQAAYRQVMAQNRHFQQQPGIHIIARPKNKRLFLISNLAPQQLRRRYLLWTWLHLLLFFAAVGGTLWLAIEQGLMG
jgi:hypothetical protein